MIISNETVSNDPNTKTGSAAGEGIGRDVGCCVGKSTFWHNIDEVECEVVSGTVESQS